MYERFTDRARKVRELATEEAKRLNHEYVGTEHVLLGLIKEGSGVAANVLKNLGLDLKKVRLEVEKIVQSGPDKVMMGRLPQTPRAKKVIEYAIEEAGNLNHKWVGTEHLLLGLLREEEGVAAQVLRNLGLTLDEVRGVVLSLLGYIPEYARWCMMLGRKVRAALRLVGGKIPAEKNRDKPPDPEFVPTCAEHERIRSLEQQLWNVRIVLGALGGALAGALLQAQFGAVMGLLLGGLVAGLGWRTVGVLAGGSVGILLGCMHLPNDGGGLAGALLGALAGYLIAEIGGPNNSHGFRGFCRKR